MNFRGRDGPGNFFLLSKRVQVIRKLLLLPFVIGCALLAGCGGGRGDLSGTVTYGGKAITSGSVTALGSDGIARTGSIEKDGSYSVKGVAAGDVKLSVASPDPVTTQKKARKKNEAVVPVDKTGWVPISDKYGDIEKSGLNCTVQANTDTKFNIDLK